MQFPSKNQEKTAAPRRKGSAKQKGSPARCWRAFCNSIQTLYFFSVFFVPLPFLVSFLDSLRGAGAPTPFPAIDLTSYGGKIVKGHISAQLSNHWRRLA